MYTTSTVEQFQSEFYERYGGQALATEMYHRGIRQFGSVQATAHRLLRKLGGVTNGDGNDGGIGTTTAAFVLSFAGYSVTVGRGNFLNQSYPMVLERILQPLLLSELNLHLTVRNAAIGGIPSFPYGFCMEHFLGHEADMVSWDYSMNEGSSGSASILEAYIRQSHNQLGRSSSSASSLSLSMSSSVPPMLLVLDTNAARCNLVQKYAEAGLLPDALCVGMAKDSLGPQQKQWVDAAMAAKTLERKLAPLEDKSKTSEHNKSKNNAVVKSDATTTTSGGSLLLSTIPVGFQNWHEFGAPPNCPGRGNWHPKYQEHALLGWMIAMYFVDAIVVAKQIMHDNPTTWKTQFRDSAGVELQHPHRHPVEFPPPMEKIPEPNPTEVIDLLFGHEQIAATAAGSEKRQRRMNPLSCRTNFLPATDTTKVLPSIVVSGLAPGVTADNIMTERTDTNYEQGWVLDVSNVERDTKVKVEQCGGLGYIDMKIALYGIPSSGPLQLWLPFESDALHSNHSHSSSATTNDPVHTNARHWFNELIVCEANEKRKPQACQLETDIEYTVGGITVTNARLIRSAAEYLKRPTCVHIGVPDQAIVTRLSQLQTRSGRPLSNEERERLQRTGRSKNQRNRNQVDSHDPIGLVVDLRAKTKVSREQGACCISHVVWEEH